LNVADRIGQNESVFREINERIELGQWPGEPDAPVAFRCECASLGCNLLIEVRLRDYERVRADPRRFIVASGHELPGVETVVEQAAGYVVVEKVGRAGEVAEQSDPREG
jgi:hypothetical protein